MRTTTSLKCAWLMSSSPSGRSFWTILISCWAVASAAELDLDCSSITTFTNTDDFTTRTQNLQNLASSPSSYMPPATCSDATVNPRGRYSSTLDPCQIQFYRVQSPGEVSLYTLPTTDICQEQNLVGGPGNYGNSSFQEYLEAWPDECVGTFLRCYSISLHQHIWQAHACRKEWTIPDDTTHISIDCTEDELATRARAQIQQVYQDPYYKQQLETQREFYLAVFILLGVLMISCFIMSCLMYRYVVRPYYENWRQERLDRLRYLKAGNSEMDETITDHDQLIPGEGEGLS